MTKPPLLLTVMIADANRASSRTLQRVLEGKPNIARVEVIGQPGIAGRAFDGAGFNCLFVDIYSLGIDAGIDLIQHVEAACPEAPICLYCDSSSLITMPDVSETWRKRFGRYFKLGKDEVTRWAEPDVDTLLGALTGHLHKALSREKPVGQTAPLETPPSPEPAGPAARAETSYPPEGARLSPDIVKQTATGWEAAVSEKVLETAVPLPTRPMLSRAEYGIEIVAPAPRAKTGRAFDITGTYTSLPAGHHIWVATVEEHDVLGSGVMVRMVKHYRPLEEASAKIISKWYAHVDYVGGKPGDFKTLVVFVVGRNGQILFDYFKRANIEARKVLAKKKTTKSLVEGSYDRLPPLLEFPDDVVECGSILVII
jgi:hypothetical protein